MDRAFSEVFCADRDRLRSPVYLGLHSVMIDRRAVSYGGVGSRVGMIRLITGSADLLWPFELRYCQSDSRQDINKQGDGVIDLTDDRSDVR